MAGLSSPHVARQPSARRPKRCHALFPAPSSPLCANASPSRWQPVHLRIFLLDATIRRCQQRPVRVSSRLDTRPAGRQDGEAVIVPDAMACSRRRPGPHLISRTLINSSIRGMCRGQSARTRPPIGRTGHRTRQTPPPSPFRSLRTDRVARSESISTKGPYASHKGGRCVACFIVHSLPMDLCRNGAP